MVKVYADGYKKSPERNKVDLTRVLSSLEQNFALRYRIAIRTAISDVVHGKTTLRVAPLPFPVEEHHRCAAMVKDRLDALTPEQAIVRGLSPKVVAWRDVANQGQAAK